MGLWYLPRFVNPHEWEALANTTGCTPQRAENPEAGTYAFCDVRAPGWRKALLTKAAPGEWERVA
jgi:hypothetical protein